MHPAINCDSMTFCESGTVFGRGLTTCVATMVIGAELAVLVGKLEVHTHDEVCESNVVEGYDPAFKEVLTVTGDCSDIDTEVGNCGDHDLSVASIGAINLIESTSVLLYSRFIPTVFDSCESGEV